MASGSISAIIKYSQVKNNLTTTAAGGVLDARQGKTLNDKITAITPTTVQSQNRSASISVATGTITLLDQVTVTAGFWIFFASANWASNATGYRQIQWNVNTTKDPTRWAASCVNAANGKQSYQQYITYEHATASTTYKLYGLQNSGTTLTCYPNIFSLKL